MKGKHEKGVVPSGTPKSGRKRNFANVIISVCVLAGLFLTVSQVWEYHRLEIPMPAEVIRVLTGLWTGELLIVALRQIFGSDVTKKDTSNNNTTGGI